MQRKAITSKEVFDRITILRSISIFAKLEDSMLEDIATQLTPQSIEAGKELFRKGAKDYALYLVVEGRVKAHVGDHTYAHFGKNQYFGEYSLLDSSLRSTTVTAVEPTKLLRFDQKSFFTLTDKRPEITHAMLKGLVWRLRDYNNLEAELTQKNIEIEKQRLRLEKHRVELEALNATKDKFFAIIAHDLRNPFSTVLGLSELLAREFETFDAESLKNFIHLIYKYSNNTFNLLENLLQWSMVQTGRMPMHPKISNLSSIIEESIELLSGNATQKQIAIDVESCKDCYVYADHNMLTAVVRNLVSNAIKFTPEQGAIRVRLLADNGFWHISVIDSGIGISKEDLKKLFLLESNPTTIGTSQEKGTGLGLILCKEFVERIGGTIHVVSEPQKGSTFTFTVPKADPPSGTKAKKGQDGEDQESE